jgi:hypothetical protein
LLTTADSFGLSLTRGTGLVFRRVNNGRTNCSTSKIFYIIVAKVRFARISSAIIERRVAVVLHFLTALRINAAHRRVQTHVLINFKQKLSLYKLLYFKETEYTRNLTMLVTTIVKVLADLAFFSVALGNAVVALVKLVFLSTGGVCNSNRAGIRACLAIPDFADEAFVGVVDGLFNDVGLSD